MDRPVSVVITFSIFFVFLQLNYEICLGILSKSYILLQNKQSNQKCFLPSRNKSRCLIFIKTIVHFERKCLYCLCRRRAQVMLVSK